MPWESAAITIVVGLVLLAATVGALAFRGRGVGPVGPKKRTTRPSVSTSQPVDPRVAAVLDRRAVRRGRPHPDPADGKPTG